MVQELLICPFDNDFTDKSGRHTLYNGNPGYDCGSVTFAEGKMGLASAYFDGTSFLISTDDETHIVNNSQDAGDWLWPGPYTSLTLTQLPNADDFLLGGTRVLHRDFNDIWANYAIVEADNNFTIDCWIRPELGGERFYPICSSANIGYYGGGYKMGWILQIDTATGHLQMIGHAAGDWQGSLLESKFQIPFDEWTHIAVSVWPVIGWPAPLGFALYKNGIPDAGGTVDLIDEIYLAHLSNLCRFGNGMFMDPTVPGWENIFQPDQWQYAPFFIGLGPRSQFTNPGDHWSKGLNPWGGYHYKGRIDNLRICQGARFLTIPDGIVLSPFTPPGIATTSTASTASTASTISTTTGTTIATTTQPPQNTDFVKDLLILPLDSAQTRDLTGRHTTASVGLRFSQVENSSVWFIADTAAHIRVMGNRADWYLGTTLSEIPYHWFHGGTSRRTLCDNNFCIDVWIKPESLGGDRYYPICSAVGCPENFTNTMAGVSLQLDTVTGHLQLIQYSFGSHLNPLDNVNNMIESRFVVPMNQWSHIAVQSWKIAPPIDVDGFVDKPDSPGELIPGTNKVFCKRNMYLNGIQDVPGGVILETPFVGVETHAWMDIPHILVNDLLIGQSYVFDFPKTNPDKVTFFFNGYMKNFRISEGPRFPTDGTPFDIFVTTTATTLSTTGTTTTAGWTTYSTTTQTATSLTTTTFYQVGLIRDLITLPFDGSSADLISNHNTSDFPTSFEGDCIRGNYSAYFDGSTKINYSGNETDWILGGTICGSYCPLDNNKSWYAFYTWPDNNFTIGSWIKIVSGGGRYYPICSSINSAGTGWSLQIDTTSRKLQMIGFVLGSHILDFSSVNNCRDQNGVLTNSIVSLIMESSFSISYDTWTHIAIVSYRTLNQTAAKLMYKNGVPDRGVNWVPSRVVWSNRGQIYQNEPDIGTGPLTVGFCQKLDLPNSGNSGDYYKGYIDYLRISEGYVFPIDGTVFIPPLDPITTATTTTETTTTLTTLSTTTLSTLTTSTTYGTTSITTNTTTRSTTSMTTTSQTTLTSTTTTYTTSTSTTTTGTTISYTTTTSWTTTTVSHTTATPIPPYQKVPTLTGRAQASNYMLEYNPGYAFDGDLNNYWICSPFDDPPYWISYTWDESYIIDQYKFYAITEGRPKSWQFQGSINGVNWDTLDEQLNVSQEGLIVRSFINTTPYSSYRLYITDVWSRLYGIRINEIQFFENCRSNKPEENMHWLGYEFNEIILIQRYCMLTPANSGFNEWKLQGSNDGIFWTDVDHQVSIDWVGWKCVDIEENNLSFSRWRLLIMNWSRFSNPKLVEFEIFKRP